MTVINGFKTTIHAVVVISYNYYRSKDWGAKLILDPFEVVCRYRDPQLKFAKIEIYLYKFMPNNKCNLPSSLNPDVNLSVLNNVQCANSYCTQNSIGGLCYLSPIYH